MKKRCTRPFVPQVSLITAFLFAAEMPGLYAAERIGTWETPPPEETAPPPDRIIESVEVHNADVRSVFRQLSAFSGVDIVLADNVTGQVTLSVTRKSWREVMMIVCKVLKLTPLKEKAYIYILPTADYVKEQLASATAAQATSEVEPLQREIIKLNNVSAAEIKTSIESMLSQRGKITVAQHNNALIILDTRQNIAQMAQVIQKLDIETAQISISCKIIEVNSGVLHEMGIQWGYFDKAGDAPVSATHLAGPQVVSSPLERLTYGILTPGKFSVALEYLCRQNSGEIVAQPQITTLDNKEARIFTGSQIPVTFLDDAGNTMVQMIDAGTHLITTPHITGEGRIMLVLNPSKKSYEFRTNVPVIHEQSATTTVVVNDGETVVIAGLTSNEVKSSEGGIPVLKDIPFLGALFKRTTRSLDKKDLVIFVTPHIIHKKVDAIGEQAGR